ncbi:hypothetical protein ACOT81_22885 [Streptomyces sp. WI04-05B]|uniref:hypothetical protein n=1 Tax=Streptomyces TaxID=1883 RepID=UPI0029AAC9C9|nr:MULTISPECIES: hypothetical protein [unclassified Streptomyces]MDX2543087.1 hypothetical protein [Streptomyces sp. WI04-05B]MDX2584872.1 hypothetical protein [Streptomyces sp. WI04-05A]
MPSRKRLMVAGLTMVLVAGLGACGGGNDTSRGSSASGNNGSGSGKYDNGSAPQPTQEPTTVSGLRGNVRHITRKTVKATRPHLVKKCALATEKVKHTSRTGTGSKKKTRTWYTTESSQTCTKVRSGTETYTRVVRQERWCVSLDDVNGDKTKDAVWFQVTHATYNEAVAADRLAPLKFDPRSTGC